MKMPYRDTTQYRGGLERLFFIIFHAAGQWPVMSYYTNYHYFCCGKGPLSGGRAPNAPVLYPP